jgi:hypothetical protein
MKETNKKKKKNKNKTHFITLTVKSYMDLDEFSAILEEGREDGFP